INPREDPDPHTTDAIDNQPSFIETSASSGRTGPPLSITSGRSRRIASITLSATFSIVVDPTSRFEENPSSSMRWYMPSPETKPGQTTEKPTGPYMSSARSDWVAPINPALVAT